MPRLQSDINIIPDKPVVMGFTRDKRLIADYKKLREDLYKIDPRLVGFRIFSESDAENYEDPDDQMLIVRDENGKCLGGACLRVSTPKKPVILNIERDITSPTGESYFSFQKNLPEMELDKYSYTEFVRIVIDPSLRKGLVIRTMFRTVLERCIEYRVRYMFGFGDAIRTRFYRQVYHGVGLDCLIDKDLDIPMRPEYEDIKMYVIHADMKKFHITPDDPNATALLSPSSDFQFD